MNTSNNTSENTTDDISDATSDATSDDISEMGSSWIFIVQMIMLMAKHQESCIFLPVTMYDTESVNSCTKYGHCQTSFTWNNVTKKLHEPSLLLLDVNNEQILECTKNSRRFVVFPLYIDYGIGKDSHSNVLIYDKIEKSIERYEPNGYIHSTDEKMDKEIASHFGSIYNLFNKDDKDDYKDDYKDDKDYVLTTYYPPINFCPRIGIQYLQSQKAFGILKTKGACSVWSVVYADTRLSNPDIPRNKIDAKILRNIEEKNTDLNTFVLSYVRNIKNVSMLLKESTSEEDIVKILINNIQV